MTTQPEPLTDTKKTLLASGARLAKELGLTPYSFNETSKHDVEFTQGQTGLVVGPNAIILGAIEVKGQDYPKNRYTEYILEDLFYFRKDEWLDEGQWKPSATDLRLPSGATLYV